ncbi:hypothetical protein WA99_01555 [Streptococcus agalactiae]|nr:hypothetical protein WA99_01555 [Streptococcus agalactiae]
MENNFIDVYITFIRKSENIKNNRKLFHCLLINTISEMKIISNKMIILGFDFENVYFLQKKYILKCKTWYYQNRLD